MISFRDVAIILELVEGTEACLDLSARFRDMSIHGGAVTSISRGLRAPYVLVAVGRLSAHTVHHLT